MSTKAHGIFRSRVIVTCSITIAFLVGTYFALPGLTALSEQSFTKSKTIRKSASVSEQLVLRLEGKPAMGFVWRLDEKRSRGLDLVTVKQLGWSFPARRGSASFTKPGILRYLVVGKRAGAARLVFEYQRNMEGASPSAYWTYEVKITH